MRERWLNAARRFDRRAFLAVPLAAAYAQDVTFTTGVRVVNVLASVRDKKGAIIADLTKDDFVLAEQGKPQTIQYFSRQGDLPLTIGLLVDTSMSQEHVLVAERTASLRFVDQVLRVDKDRVFVLQFDSRVVIKQTLTNSYTKLEAALAEVDTPTRGELRRGIGGGTVLFDAVDTGARFLLKDVPGRKALILLTDGVDYGSNSSLAEAVEAAQKQDTIIYSILFADRNGDAGRGALVRLSHETGGAFYQVSKRLSIEQIYALIQNELRSQYNLGYVSNIPVQMSEFRKIQLTTRQKELIVQARDRYWARP
ncbi:MAG: VWA domain-containing protein [Acidobacteria bacterium]|nr:VWA domain-containing protein [Acidobacteriota bacterium]